MFVKHPLCDDPPLGKKSASQIAAPIPAPTKPPFVCKHSTYLNMEIIELILVKMELIIFG